MADEAACLAAITESLRLIVQDARDGKLPAEYSPSYDKVYTSFIVGCVQGSLDVEGVAHHLAGAACTARLAALRIVKLEAELAAIKQTFNLP